MKGVKIYLCQKYTGKTLKEIGRHFDIGKPGVSQASRWIALKISQDNQLRKKIRKIEGLRKSKKYLEYRIQKISNELNELKKRSAPETLNKEV